MDHVARRSLTPVDGGYQWKFDREVFAQFAGRMRAVALPHLRRWWPASPCSAPSTAW